MKFLAIAGNTFVESLRQPVFGILMWVAAGLLAINPSIAAFSLESGGDNKVMKDIGLSTLLLWGLFGSVFTATAVITREIESFTVLTVVSKPVGRPLFLAGKFAGVLAALLVGYYFLTLVLLMTVQHGVMETVADKYDLPVITLSLIALGVGVAFAGLANFAWGWHFSSTLTATVVPLGTAALVGTLLFDRQWNPQSPAVDAAAMTQVVYAVGATFGGVMVLTALAVTVSTRAGQVPTLMTCAGVFGLGLLCDYLFVRRAEEGLPWSLLARVVPNFQFFWLGDAITQELTIGADYVLRVVAYATVYSAALLALGIALFQTREVG